MSSLEQQIVDAQERVEYLLEQLQEAEDRLKMLKEQENLG